MIMGKSQAPALSDVHETQSGRNNSAYVLNSSLTHTFRKQKPKCMQRLEVTAGTAIKLERREEDCFPPMMDNTVSLTASGTRSEKLCMQHGHILRSQSLIHTAWTGKNVHSVSKSCVSASHVTLRVQSP